MSTTVHLASVGDTTNPGVYSGTPYHLLQAGATLGLPFHGLRLCTDAPSWRARRLLWNSKQVSLGRGVGGYQYSDAFLTTLWQQERAPAPSDFLLNLFQLYPRERFNAAYNAWFYIDQTLTQLFEYYGFGRSLPSNVVEDAVRRETEQYQQCAGVMCFSRWVAEELIERYGLPKEKVHVVIAGANLDDRALAQWDATSAFREDPGNRPLKLLFVGKEWERKGLDRLLRALRLVHARGVSAELLVLGLDPAALPADLQSVPNVTWGGFVNKRTDAAKFLDLVAGCDVGCLLSRAEASGMSLREFSRLGLPTIAPLTGGSPEYVIEEATSLIAPEASDEEVAESIVRLASDPDLLHRQRSAAWAMRKTAGWDATLRHIAAVMGIPQGAPRHVTLEAAVAPRH